MLRPYQVAFNANLAKAVSQSKRVIACLPTGGGKTKCFLAIANNALSKGRTVLIISETRKIFDQICAEGDGIEIKAGAKSFVGVMPDRLYIAMAQTLSRRPLIISQFADLNSNLLVIVDEAHVGTATKLLQQLPGALLVGFTATPDWNAGKHLSELYRGCVVGAQVDDLIQEGFLSPYRHYARVGANLDALKLQAGEFTDESQSDAFQTTQVFDGLIEDLRVMPFKKCLIFTSSIKHCRELTEQLSAHFYCVQVHSQEQNASYNLHQFMAGGINICVSVGVLTKGFDFPGIDLIIIQRATTSLPLYLQMCGRGSRIAEGKAGFVVLDYGENYKRHGLWDMDRDWEKMWLEQKKQKKKDKKGVAPVKECPSCQAILTAGTAVCPYCKFEIEKQGKPLQTGELVEITQKYNALVGRRVSQLSPAELAAFAKLKNKKAFCIRIAKAQEQKHPGWLREFADAMNYKTSWVRHQEIGHTPIDFYDITLR